MLKKVQLSNDCNISSGKVILALLLLHKKKLSDQLQWIEETHS